MDGDGTLAYTKVYVYLDGNLVYISSGNLLFEGEHWIDVNVTNVQNMTWVIDPLGGMRTKD